MNSTPAAIKCSTYVIYCDLLQAAESDLIQRKVAKMKSSDGTYTIASLPNLAACLPASYTTMS